MNEIAATSIEDADGNTDAVASDGHGADSAHAVSHPKLQAAWARVRPYAKISLYGAAFVGGGLLLAKIFGPGTARQLGRDGGEAFAQGVAKVQNQLAGGRGSRWP